MSKKRSPQLVDRNAVRQVLGASAAALIDKIASQAQANKRSLYLVGGVPRDIILKLPNQDLDFVLETDAISFADELAARYGGSVLAHKPFGTAVWTLDGCAAETLGLPAREIPQYIDFARARSETYSEPAALPTVSPAGIKSDLLRRDFTLNALAIQLSPASVAGQLLDESGGLADLQSGLIRVLHERSFIDDPTRILRAIRLATRQGFAIETETDELMRAALPLLGRLTGQRLVNEIELSLGELKAGEIFLRLQDLGALGYIHPAFRVNCDITEVLNRARETSPPWKVTADKETVPWRLLMARVGADEADAICQRLDLPRTLTRSMVACAQLIGAAAMLSDAESPPSQAARLLDGLPAPALHAAWLLFADNPAAQDKLANYMSTWRQQKASINGVHLERMGIPPGPSYKRILDALRFAWIDGEVNSPEEEALYLGELLSADV